MLCCLCPLRARIQRFATPTTTTLAHVAIIEDCKCRNCHTERFIYRLIAIEERPFPRLHHPLFPKSKNLASMDRLPQGLPPDYRQGILQLMADPLHGGPPASGVGQTPDEVQYHPLGLPLPNFEGLHPADNLPCHISNEVLRRHYEERREDWAQSTGPCNLEGSTRDFKALIAMQLVHYFASQQPLTVKPLPDGSNIYNAPPGSVEEGFKDAFTWYKRWLEFLHYSNYTVARFDRLKRISELVKHWKREQELFPPVEPSQVNGLYPVPPLIQHWIWPWHFSLVWQIRRDLVNVASPHGLDISIEMLDNLLDAETSTEFELDVARWAEDRYLQMNIRDDTLRNYHDMISNVLDEVDACGVAARGYFKTRALRYWGFKRPWRKLWLVMDSEPLTQEMEYKVTELQGFLNRDIYGSQLLEVHPILAKQLREKADECVISACGGEPWKESDIVLETWCGHVVCMPCMFQHWFTHFDQLDRGQIPNPVLDGDWPCPMCRTSPGRLRSKVDIAQTYVVGDAGDVMADNYPLWQPHGG